MCMYNDKKLSYTLNPNANLNSSISGDFAQNFFSETEDGKLVPRTLFVDLDPTAVGWL